MKRLGIVGLVLAAGLGLTACSTDGGQRDGMVGGEFVYVFTRTVPDGRSIPCITIGTASVSCDWSKP